MTFVDLWKTYNTLWRLELLKAMQYLEMPTELIEDPKYVQRKLYVP